MPLTQTNPIDSSIPMGFKTPDGMESMSSMLDVGSKMLSLQKAQQTFDSDVAESKAKSSTAQSGAAAAKIKLGETQAIQQIDPSQYVNPDGTINYNKALPLIMKAAPTTGMDYVKNFMATQQQATDAGAAINKLDQTKRNQLSSFATAQQGNSPEQIASATQELGKDIPSLVPSFPHFQDSIQKAFASGGQPAVNDLLSRFGKSVETAPIQQGMNTPNGVPVDDGSQKYNVNTKPNVPGIPQYGVVPGSGSTTQPGPTTPYINPVNNQPMIKGANPNPGPGQLGSQNSSAAWSEANAASNAARNDTEAQTTPLLAERKQAVANGDTATVAALDRQIARVGASSFPTSGPVATGMLPGQDANIKDNVDAMNTHFAKLSGPASDAQLALSLTDNIKTLAQSAMTGTTAGRQAYVNGLLNSFKLGNQATGDLQKDTDLLEKYMAQLNLTTPAASDAARTLISAARPHGTMKDTAIIEAADQISSVIKANLDTRNYLSKWKYANNGAGDSVGYAAQKQQVEQLADPRIWQMQGKTAVQQSAFMDALKSPSQVADLMRKSRALHNMGVIQ